jgi:hypothetical protein
MSTPLDAMQVTIFSCATENCTNALCSRLHFVPQMLLLKKVLYTLHKHARQSSALRRALASLHRRHLQYSWRALQQALAALLQRPTAALTPVKALTQQQQVVVRDGRGRQGHCKCVYGVTGSGSRCRCAPAAHLLRRVEELHKLVTHAMHSPDYRLLSHVTQYRVVSSDSSTNATAATANDTNNVSAGRVSRDVVEQQAASRRHLCYDDVPSAAATGVSSGSSVSKPAPQQQQQQQKRVPLQSRPRTQRDRPQPTTSSSSPSSALNRRAAASSSKANQFRQPATAAAAGRPRKNRPNPNATPTSSSSVYSNALHSRAPQQQQQQQRRSKSPVRARRPQGMPPRHDMSHW